MQPSDTEYLLGSSNADSSTNAISSSSLSDHQQATTTTTSSKKRSLGAFGVCVVSFAAVAGGPYGIEESVGVGGGFPTLMALLLTAIAWSATQALVTAELSTMMPSNAGYIAWVIRGLDPIAGFVNAWNGMLSASCNIPLYPVLIATYVQQIFPSVSQEWLWGVKLSGLAVVVVLNIIGVEAVEVFSLVMVLLVQTPFIIMPITSAVLGQKFHWEALGQSTEWLPQFAVFISTVCWCSQGWVTLGNIAAEVKNPKRSYPLGLGASVGLVALNYIYPVAVCVAMAPDSSQWTTGYFVTIAQGLSAWLGYWALVGGALSCMANFVPQMTVAVRAMRAAAEYKIIPVHLLTKNMTKYDTPVPAIVVQAAIVTIMMSFSFNTLVVTQILFTNVGLALQFAAFIRLKYTEPDAKRPFAVPGGKAGAWLLTLPFAVLLCMMFYSSVGGGDQTLDEVWIVVGVNVCLLIGGIVWKKYGYDEKILQVDATAFEEEEKGEGEKEGGGEKEETEG